MADNQVLFIPITKVDEVKREVWGRATQEVPDASREIMDYASSKPEFSKWSEAAHKRSGGKSLGNLRAMHKAVAAGKLISLDFNDAEKAVDVGTYVGDDEEWRKVLDGIYTGFSVGGSYAKRWMDGSLMRYTARPSELSLVDAPCVPTATFALVKQDGTTELRKFQNTQALEKQVVQLGPAQPETIGSGEVVTEIQEGDVQPAVEAADTRGVEVAGVKRTNEPANPNPGWLDKFETVVLKFNDSVDKYDQILKAEAANQDKALNELKARGSRVGIARREGEPLAPPKDYPTDPAQYADPANWKFPCDESRGSTAVGYYNGGNSRDKYSPREWAVLGRRIASLASASTGTKYIFSAEEKKINRKEEKAMNELTMKKGTDVNSLLAEVKAAMNGAVEAIQSDPSKAQDLLMQALSAVDVASDMGTPAGSDVGSGHAPTGKSPTSLEAAKAAASPTPGAGPDKPQQPSGSSAPQTPQQPSATDTSSTGTPSSDYSKLEKQVSDLTDMVKALAGSLKKDAPADVVPAEKPPVPPIPEEPPVTKNLPAGDLQAIVGNAAGQTDLAKMLQEDPVGGLRKAVRETGKSPDQLQNEAQELFIHALVDDGRISARSHQILQPPL